MIWENEKIIFTYDMRALPKKLAFVSDSLLLVMLPDSLLLLNYKSGCTFVTRLTVSFIMYNAAHDFVYFIDKGGTSRVWRGPFTDTYDFSTSEVFGMGVPISFSASGEHAFCTSYNSCIEMYDVKTLGLKRRMYMPDFEFPLTGKMVETRFGDFVYARYNSKLVCVLGETECPTPFNGPEIIGSTDDNQVIVREWGTAGRVYALKWGWWRSVRKAFCALCL